MKLPTIGLGSLISIAILLTGLFIVAYCKPLIKAVNGQGLNNLTDSTYAYLYYNGQPPKEYNDNEISHLKDVKLLMNSLKVVWLTLLIVSLALIVKLHKIRSEAMVLAGVILLLFSLLMLVAIFNFDKFFIALHCVFFPHGNWQFPAGSLILKVFPSTYFSLAALLVLVFILFSACVLIIMGKLFGQS